MPTINWWLLGICAFFFVKENQYFGWNFSPKSDAEILADGICLVLLALSLKGGA